VVTSSFRKFVVVQLQEDFLCDLCLKLGGRAPKDAEAEVEPFVDIGVDGMVFVA
jgi:hypothetical protein